MLGFVQNWFAHRSNPIGVDFGSDSIRLAQVQEADGEHRLVAAASADLPHHIRQDKPARLTFFGEALRDLLARGNFGGRQAVLSLPACIMQIQHVRVPKTDEQTLKQTLPWELRGKLSIDPSLCLLRHVIAGEVYQDEEPRYEVVVMAAPRDLVDGLLAAAARAKVEVVGMNVEPMALVDCFGHVYRRRGDTEAACCYLDIGCSASRAVIAKGNQILFARIIPVGGDNFNRAVSERLKISFEEAKTLRIRLCQQQPAAETLNDKPQAAAAPAESEDNSFALLGAGLAAAGAQQPQVRAVANEPGPRQPDEHAAVAEACREPLARLIEELALCRRYYEATFPASPIGRLVFVGGEARHRSLCQQIACEMGVVAQVGDPMVRMAKNSDVGIESGIDRRQPQPSWAVAIGLSMGPVRAEKRAAKR